MARVMDFNQAKAPKPARKPRATPQRRKAADEWRAINRSHRVKDGRPLILAVPDPRRPGEHIIGEGYWHVEARSWWWANTAPGLVGCDAIADLCAEPEAWMPMPSPPGMLPLTEPTSARR